MSDPTALSGLHSDGHGYTPTHAPRPAAAVSPAAAAAVAPLPRVASGVKGRPIYTPMEVELEAPEPAPHNPSADDAPGLADAAEVGEEEAVVRSGLGIMRTSRVPQYSQLQAQRQSEAAAYAANFKPKAKKAGHIVVIAPIAALPATTPSNLSAPPPISYSAALKKSNPRLLAALQSAALSDSADSQQPQLEFAHDLPPEQDSGNCEYKLKLVHKSQDRVVHLTTQMAYRLSEGHGECLYELGVQDSGYAQGLTSEELEQSIQVVMDMAATLRAEGTVITKAWGKEGLVAEVRVRRVGEQQVILGSPTSRTTAHERMEGDDATASSSSGAVGLSPALTPSPPLLCNTSPLLTPLSSSSTLATPVSGDLRLALVGGSSSGKSSLLGCLISNQLDDARGRARLHVVRHRHEVECGRGSAIARQVLGFDSKGAIVNYTVHHTQTLGLAAAVPVQTASPFGSPQQQQQAAPAVAEKKKDKGISSLFGGGSDEDESDEDESSGGEESDMDFGFEPSPDQQVLQPDEQLVSFGSSAAVAAPAVSLSLSGGESSGQASMDWQRIVSQSFKVYTIFDMPGHVDSSRTALYGLLGTSCPDYCCIVVSCTNGIESTAAVPTTTTTADNAASSTTTTVAAPSSHTPLISSLTREQILICAALNIPCLLLLCKADLAGPDARHRIVRALHTVCAEATAPPLSLSDPTNGQQGPPPGAVIVRHKIPLLLAPPPPPASASSVDAPPSADSLAAAAEAEAELQAIIDLLERNQVGGVYEADIPLSLRPLLARTTLTRTRSGGAAPMPPITPSAASASASAMANRWFPQHTFCPILMLSNVTGEGMELFTRTLQRLHNWKSAYWATKIRRAAAPQPQMLIDSFHAAASSSVAVAAPAPTPTPVWESVGVEYSIDETFTVEGVGSVVSGTILAGVINEGDTLLLGPLSGNEGVPLPSAPASWPAWCRGGNDGGGGGGSCFRPVLVKSLHLSRKSFKNARAGQSATLALKRTDRALLRRGMVLLSVPPGYGIGSIARPMPAAAAAAPVINSALQPQRRLWPRSCVGFEAYVRFFDPSNTNSVVARALRESRDSGGSASGTGLNRRRMAAANGNANGAGGASRAASPPLAGLSGALSLRGQPIVHVGNVRQTGEVVLLRPVRLKKASSHRAVEAWISAQQARTEARDLDETHEPPNDLATLLDQLEAQEAEQEVKDDASSASSSTVAASTPAAPLHALVRFDFLYQSEFLRLGRAVLFRDERTRATGRITNICFVDHEDDPAAIRYAQRNESQSSSRITPPPPRKRSSPGVPQQQQQQGVTTDSPPPASASSASNANKRGGVSSPPLPSISPPAVASAFQRTKERRAWARKEEAQLLQQQQQQQQSSMAAAAAASSSTATTSADLAAVTAAALEMLPHSRSTSSLQQPPVTHSQSHCTSPCLGPMSPLTGPRPVRAAPASMQCTPMLSAAAWSNLSVAGLGLAGDQLQLPASEGAQQEHKEREATQRQQG